MPQSPDIGQGTQAQKNAEKKAKKQAKAAQQAAANGTAEATAPADAAVTAASLNVQIVHCVKRSCLVCMAFEIRCLRQELCVRPAS